MGDQATAQAPRLRVSAAQDAKGAFKLDATAEVFDGGSPVGLLVQTIQDAEAALEDAGYQVVKAPARVEKLPI